MPSDKRYAVVTNATRQTFSYNPYQNGNVERGSYDYRRGELGLLHPTIIDFFGSYEENMRMHAAKSIMATKASPIIYFHEEGDIPVLLYAQSLIGWSHKRPVQYLIAILKDGEFEEISDTDFGHVRNSVVDVRTRNKIYTPNDFERSLDEQYRHLTSFDILMSHRIHDIPVETAWYSISDDYLDDI